ncbi:MAG TPA: hypothetical protein DEA16_01265 [Opitutae bacterium]|nr:hypothetical protein [Opitutae bacterium]
MKNENILGQDIEKIYYTGITAIRAMQQLSYEDDGEMASLAGAFLEQMARVGSNCLVDVAGNNPEALKSRASICSDWPGFIPEHKASRDANQKMLKIIGLGSAVSYKIKDANLGTHLQEFVSSMYFELTEARAQYRVDLNRFGDDGLPAWRHEAASLPCLSGSLDDRMEWFTCGWNAFVFSQDGQPLHENSHISALGLPGAEQRANNRKHTKLSRLRKQLRQWNESLEAHRMDTRSKAESLDVALLQHEIELLEASGLDIRDSEIVERAQNRIRDAFLGRLNV